MDNASIQALNALNNAFYRTASASFSQTRQSPWDGWERVADCWAREQHAPACRVLDVACGNLRFERYLEERHPETAFSFTCLDSCRDLARPQPSAQFVDCDIVERLMAGRPFPAVQPEGFDLVVSFGFLHHVPTAHLRERLMAALLDAVRPGGVAAVSFWQFMKDERLARKAVRTTQQACSRLGVVLEQGDYLLDWNDQPDLYRYCHDFTDEEIAAFASAARQRGAAVERFSADGRSGALNGYLVMRA